MEMASRDMKSLGMYLSGSIESATCLGIPDCLVKEVSEIIEECVLFLDIEGEGAIEETGDVILVLFADLLNAVPNDKQSDIP